MGPGLLHKAFDLSGLRQVGDERGALPAKLADLVRKFLCLLDFMKAVHQHLPTGLGQLQGGGSADTGACADDDRTFHEWEFTMFLSLDEFTGFD